MANKDLRVGFRITEEEKLYLESKARESGLLLSRYLRNIIRNSDGVFSLFDDNIEFLKKEFATLNRYGSKVNQIARNLNIRKSNNELGDDNYYLIKACEVESLRSELEQTRVHIQDIMQQISDMCKNHKVN